MVTVWWCGGDRRSARHAPAPSPRLCVRVAVFAVSVTDFDVTFPVCIGLTLACLGLLGCVRRSGWGGEGVRAWERLGGSEWAVAPSASRPRQQPPARPTAQRAASVGHSAKRRQAGGEWEATHPLGAPRSVPPCDDPPPLAPRRAQLLMMFNGGLAAGASYLVGWGLQEAVGRGGCL